MFHRILAAGLIGLALLIPAVAAAQSSRERPFIGAVFTADAPGIDGLLDEPAWQSANLVDTFVQQEPTTGQPATDRTARAEGQIVMRPETLALIREGDAKKGDVIGTARLAGIMAAKRTHELIPLCHPLLLSKVRVECEPDDALPGLRIAAEVRVQGPTGVEMEALTAVSVACLTVYDMVKAVDRGVEFSGIRLIEKTGGRSGTFRRA